MSLKALQSHAGVVTYSGWLDLLFKIVQLEKVQQSERESDGFFI